MYSFSADVNFTCDVTKESSFARTSLTVNYRLFKQSDVSFRFIDDDDNVVLQFTLAFKC